MVTYRDMTFCSNRDCTFTPCPRHVSKISWAALPAHMPVSFADFTGKETFCYKPQQKEKEGKENG